MPSHPDPGARLSRLTPQLMLTSLLLLWGLLAVSQAAVPSAITSDGTLRTTVSQRGTIYDITGGTRPANGPNLFHSFDRFSVGTGDTARFSGETGIANILSRVTGGQPSAIDGRLESTMSGANLYLLNPSGVLFGSNASLSVSGSFHVSTADFLRFADGAKFSANLGQESVLTMESPAAFGFLGPMPAPIIVQGSMLKVPHEKTLSVVGGNVQIIGGTLSASSGRIQLASVASPGEVMWSPLALTPELRVDSFPRLGRLEVTEQALLDADGTGGGTVLLRGGHLRVDRSQVRARNTGAIEGTGLGIDLEITAEAIIANGATLTADSMRGRAGDVRLMADSIRIDGAVISSSVFSEGHLGGGQVTIMATEAIVISGSSSSVKSVGPVTITAPTVRIEGGAVLTETRASNQAGDIVINAGQLTLTDEALISSSTIASGRGGDILIMVDRLTLTGGTGISGINSDTAGATQESTGLGGHISITATDVIAIAGQYSGVSTATRSHGRGGDITLQAREIRLSEGASLSATSTGTGDAGRLTMTATEHLRLDRSTLTARAAQANGGEIVLQAGHGVQLWDGSTITASVEGGPTTVGGTLTITAPFVVLEGSPKGRQIIAQATQGRGGDDRHHDTGAAG